MHHFCVYSFYVLRQLHLIQVIPSACRKTLIFSVTRWHIEDRGYVFNFEQTLLVVIITSLIMIKFTCVELFQHAVEIVQRRHNILFTRKTRSTYPSFFDHSLKMMLHLHFLKIIQRRIIEKTSNQ